MSVSTLTRPCTSLTLLLIVFLSILLTSQCADSKKVAKKAKDLYDNKGHTPFFLQDPFDQMCLSPHGFTVCDERALWILTTRVGKKDTYSIVSLISPEKKKCLTRQSGFLGLYSSDNIGMDKCTSSASKSWSFDFIDKTHIKLSTNDYCIVRGKKKYKNVASLVKCSKGDMLPLVYQPTPVHEAGFYLKSADGKCFDGSSFRVCEGTGSSRLLWGIGIKYVHGEAKRYFFGFSAQEREQCIVASGTNVSKDSCKSSGALGWGIHDGALSYKEKYCLARLTDNTATLALCTETSEYVVMDIPTFFSKDDAPQLKKA